MKRYRKNEIACLLILLTAWIWFAIAVDLPLWASGLGSFMLGWFNDDICAKTLDRVFKESA